MIPKYNITNLPSHDILPFWKPWGPMKYCCQWYESPFTENNITYSCTEQYMMAKKALLFGDTTIYSRIMSTSDPEKMRKLGRQIKGFDQSVWDAEKYEIVYQGNLLKFSQNPELRDWLLGTAPKTLVEASPFDGIWGVKMKAQDSEIQDPKKWRGQNLLGFALMEVRDVI